METLRLTGFLGDSEYFLGAFVFFCSTSFITLEHEFIELRGVCFAAPSIFRSLKYFSELEVKESFRIFPV
jgi:hypothetical protein